MKITYCNIYNLQRWSASLLSTETMFINDADNATPPMVPVFHSTPLIYFPPELAYQINVATYIHIGCLAVSHHVGR